MMNRNWDFIRTYAPEYMKAARLTVHIGLAGICFSLLIGMIAAVVLHFRIRVLSRLFSCYIELSRNTPLLVQIFFLYFGLPKLGIRFRPETCGVIGLSFLGGGYMAEAFRSSLEAVDQIQY